MKATILSRNRRFRGLSVKVWTPYVRRQSRIAWDLAMRYAGPARWVPHGVPYEQKPSLPGKPGLSYLVERSDVSGSGQITWRVVSARPFSGELGRLGP